MLHNYYELEKINCKYFVGISPLNVHQNTTSQTTVNIK